MNFEQTLLKWQCTLEKVQFFLRRSILYLTLYAFNLWVSFSFINSTQQSTAISHSGWKVLPKLMDSFSCKEIIYLEMPQWRVKLLSTKEDLGFFYRIRHCIMAVAPLIAKAK